MEACGAEQHVLSLFASDLKVFISTLVSDEDASVRARLKHKYRDQLELEDYDLKEWPLYSNGKKTGESWNVAS